MFYFKNTVVYKASLSCHLKVNLPCVDWPFDVVLSKIIWKYIFRLNQFADWI